MTAPAGSPVVWRPHAALLRLPFCVEYGVRSEFWFVAFVPLNGSIEGKVHNRGAKKNEFQRAFNICAQTLRSSLSGFRTLDFIVLEKWCWKIIILEIASTQLRQELG